MFNLHRGQVENFRTLRIPRSVNLVRVPSNESSSLHDVLHELSNLPQRGPDEDIETHPFLEVAVELDKPEPGLHTEIRNAVKDKAVRLVKITITRTGHGRALGDNREKPVELSDVYGVFKACYEQRYSTKEGTYEFEKLTEIFSEICDEVSGEKEETA